MRKFSKSKKATGFLALALAGIMTISGSLAYFTDRKEIEASQSPVTEVTGLW